MKIAAKFTGNNSRVTPDVAHVRLGDFVTWDCQSELLPVPRRLAWRFYFDDASPFGSLKQFVILASGPGLAVLATTPPALIPGDFKYGIEVTDADSHERLSDDDPWIIVR